MLISKTGTYNVLFSEMDSSLVTLSDVLRSVKKLKEETERLESKLNQTDRQVQIEKAKLNSFIAKIQQELLMGKKHFLNKQSLCIMHYAVELDRRAEASRPKLCFYHKAEIL